jgi:RNA polymerase sigma factor (sigma-70 family)
VRREGDRDTRFLQLFDQTRADLLAYAIRRTTSPEEAADVVAETYLIAWRKIDSLPQGDERRLWLFGVARNVLRRGASHEQELRSVVNRLASELRELEATSSEPLRDERTSTAALRAALVRLPERQREALLLTAWEELSPREVAAVTGVPVNLVRVRLHRARAQLRHALCEAERLGRSRASPTASQAG